MNPKGLWSRMSPCSLIGVRPGAPSGSAAPDHQRFVEQPALLQIAQQAGDRLIELLSKVVDAVS